MAGRQAYIVANVNGIDTERVLKAGKAPQFAIWAKVDGEWHRVGWSYQANKMDAINKSAAHKQGFPTKATRVLPAA